MKNPDNLFNSKVLFEFFKAPSFKAALDASTRAKLQAKVGHYKQISQDKVQRLAFQERAVKSACAKRGGLWCGELWTGAGKSIIAARIALYFLASLGKVIFICPNRMGIGSASDGIIQKFHRTFESFSPGRYRVGELDHVTRLDDVHFFTPAAFVKAAREMPAFFKKLLSETALLVVDEAHHFPDDPKEDQVIYGKVEQLASEHFLDAGKKVVTLTATHGRHDGKLVFKKEHPDFQITVNEAVQAGWCPEIHGLPVYLKMKAPKAVARRSDYHLNLSSRQKSIYLRQVAAIMIQIQKENPDQQFCAFVTTIPEAVKLTEIWNHEAIKLGFKPVALLVSRVIIGDRFRIKKDIQEGRYAGYVTCSVGSESIDIPKMEAVHMIRRTRSINRLVQSIGRTLRIHPGKRRALVVDYNLSERKIINACKGLEAYAAYVRTPAKRLVSGGPIVPIMGSKNADFSGISIGEERAWIEKSLKKVVIKSGTVFGWLTVIEYADASHVLCQCKCGKEYETRSDLLKNKKRISCGCYKKQTAEIPAGARFGKLVVLEYQDNTHVICKCDCGKRKTTSKGSLVSGHTKSCGCNRFLRSLLKPGSRFRKLTVVKDEGPQKVAAKCDCGRTIVVSRKFIKRNSSCGCVRPREGVPLKAGRKFGLLKVLEDSGHHSVRCLCECGKKLVTSRSHLRMGGNVSCGCFRIRYVLPEHRSKVIILSRGILIKRSSTFGSLAVTRDAGCHDVHCVCRCGSTMKTSRSNLLKGIINSCGCESRSPALKKGAIYGLLKIVHDGGPSKVSCLCKCGKSVIKIRAKIVSSASKSCGCLKLGKAIPSGSRFGKLVVLSDDKASAVKCRCDCGKVISIVRWQLKNNKRKSCGCSWRKDHRPIRSGKKFGYWTVLKGGDTYRPVCRCRCGVKRTLQRKHLYAGVTQSCGCKNGIPKIKTRKTFGRLTVLRDSGGAASRSVLCRCRCGKRINFRITSLLNGTVTSCQCRKGPPPVRKGQRFGLLKVIEDRGTVECICDCGKKKFVMRNVLRKGFTKSCGPLHGVLKVGSKYGLWTVLSDRGCHAVKARCRCGFVKKNHDRGNLRLGGSKACQGCSKKSGYSRDAS